MINVRNIEGIEQQLLEFAESVRSDLWTPRTVWSEIDGYYEDIKGNRISPLDEIDWSWLGTEIATVRDTNRTVHFYLRNDIGEQYRILIRYKWSWGNRCYLLFLTPCQSFELGSKFQNFFSSSD